jgi:hypothetical protein
MEVSVERSQASCAQALGSRSRRDLAAGDDRDALVAGWLDHDPGPDRAPLVEVGGDPASVSSSGTSCSKEPAVLVDRRRQGPRGPVPRRARSVTRFDGHGNAHARSQARSPARGARSPRRHGPVPGAQLHRTRSLALSMSRASTPPLAGYRFTTESTRGSEDAARRSRPRRRCPSAATGAVPLHAKRRALRRDRAVAARACRRRAGPPGRARSRPRWRRARSGGRPAP